MKNGSKIVFFYTIVFIKAYLFNFCRSIIYGICLLTDSVNRFEVQ